MQITIDTKHDSKEEIRKVISLLQQLMSDHAYSNIPRQNNIFEKPESEPVNIFQNLPSSQPEPVSETAPSEGQANVFNSLFGPAESADKPDEPAIKEPEENTDQDVGLIPY